MSEHIFHCSCLLFILATTVSGARSTGCLFLERSLLFVSFFFYVLRAHPRARRGDTDANSIAKRHVRRWPGDVNEKMQPAEDGTTPVSIVRPNMFNRRVLVDVRVQNTSCKPLALNVQYKITTVRRRVQKRSDVNAPSRRRPPVPTYVLAVYRRDDQKNTGVRL